MTRATGYLAQLINTPPLIFRFQFNPTSVSEKRSYKYEEEQGFGKWDFSKTKAATRMSAPPPESSALSTVFGFVDDLASAGPKLTNTKGRKAGAGSEPRKITLEFQLDARIPGPADGDVATGDSHYGGSLEPDLAILRSFVNPAWDPVTLTGALMKGQFPAPEDPPECTFIYAGLSLTCVMTDLDIKVVEFQESGAALRAEVNVTLVEQTHSAGVAADTLVRAGWVARSFARKGIAKDVLLTTPVVGSIAALFD